MADLKLNCLTEARNSLGTAIEECLPAETPTEQWLSTIAIALVSIADSLDYMSHQV